MIKLLCGMIGLLGWLFQPATFLDGDFSDLDQRELTNSAGDWWFRADQPLPAHSDTNQKGGNNRRA